MGPVLGIDLGTTNSVVAVVKEGVATVLADDQGRRLIPSVVSFHPNGTVIVGEEARQRRLIDAPNTIYSIKRLIGRSWDSEEVRTARSRFPFELREGPGQAALIVARGETYTLPEISAFVLRKAKAVAEAALGEEVERAVVTVPANFNDLQRAATKVAGRVAGLEVVRIINEPTAAALAYGFGKTDKERIAVYDFGGGTFDVTLLDLADGVFEVLATAGNTFLGGDDLDEALTGEFAQQFLKQHRYDVRQDPQAHEQLLFAAEQVKRRLSTDTEATVDIPEVAHGPGGKPLGFRASMTRAELERLARPLVERTFDVCREALGIARLQPGDFDRVLLVGGSTRVPLVRAQVEEFFRRPIQGDLSPDEVVALGAALQGQALSGTERRHASQIPSAPRPGRATDPALTPKSRPPQPRGRGTLPPQIGLPPAGARPRLDTHPGLASAGRPRMPTSPGLAREAAPARGRPMVIQPPRGLGAEGAPNTQQQRSHERSTTNPGLLAPAQPAATPGRRVTSPTGVSPATPPAPGPKDGAASLAPASTLMSAGAAAREAIASVHDEEPGGAPQQAKPGAGRSRLPTTTQRQELGVPAAAAALAAELPIVTAQGLAREATPAPPPAHAPTPGPAALAPPLVSPPVAPSPRAGAAPAAQQRRTAPLAAAAPLPLVSPATPAPPLAASPTPPPVAPAAAPSARRDSSTWQLDPDELITEASVQADFRSLGMTQSASGVWQLSEDDVTAVEEDIEQLEVPAEFGAPEPAAPPAAAAAPLGTRTQVLPTLGAPPQVPPTPEAAPWAPPTAPVTAPAWSAPPMAAAAPPPASLTPAQPPAAWPGAVALGGIAAAPAPIIREAPQVPLLIDVTPLSLVVETVGGYCDTVIERNTPVPTSRTREFVTGKDNQTHVRVRVSQGESEHFAENTLLGELELAGLRAAPRGAVRIAVSFALDTDGILNVAASDVQTGQATTARLQLVGATSAADLQRMAQRHARHPM